MDKDRRGTLLALVTGAAASLLVLAARRGVPGARRVAARLAPRPAVPAKGYGYQEINLS